MDKKRSVGVTVVGVTEVILGIIGLMVILFSVQPAHSGGPLPPYLCFGFTICFLIPFLLLGILTIRLKPIARKIHIFCSPFLSFIIMGFIWMFVVDSPYHIFFTGVFRQYLTFKIIMWTIFLLMMSGSIFYFTRPKVKEQFR